MKWKKWYSDSIYHNLASIRIDSYNSSLKEKMSIFHNVIIPIKLVVKKNKDNYYCNVFLEKGLYEDKFNSEYFQMNVCIV